MADIVIATSATFSQIFTSTVLAGDVFEITTCIEIQLAVDQIVLNVKHEMMKMFFFTMTKNHTCM